MIKDAKIFSYQTRLKSLDSSAEILDAFGTLYGSMERHLFCDLIDKKNINTLKSSYINKFGVTARCFNGCLRLLQGKIESIRQSRIGQIENLKNRIKVLTKKIPRIKKHFVKHQKNRSLNHLIYRLDKLETEKKEGAVSLCFGGKKLYHAQYNLKENNYSSQKEWKEDWTDARSSEFFCIGSKDETGGNQSCVMTLSETGEGRLRLRLPHALAQKHGKYVIIPVSFIHGKDQILKALASKQALSYRFKKDEKGWRVFVSFEHARAPVVTKEHIGAIGIDMNVDHIAVVETDAKGNPIDKKTIPLCTYGKRSDQAKALIGDVVKEIVLLAKEKEKPIIREELDFTKKKATLREDTAKRARMLSSFHYSSFIENLESKAFREGVFVGSVNPAFTSIIGKVKFAVRYGMSAHHSAALVIARRYYSFSENLSQCMVKVMHKQVHVTFPLPEWTRGKHVWTLWRKVGCKMKAVLVARFLTSPDSRYCRSG